MILPIMDCATGTVTVFETFKPKVPGGHRLRVITPEELQQRCLRAYGFTAPTREDLATGAMCGMFQGPYGPEDYQWR